jgi:2-polyprenyl-3-methyl-5-hydroxy-6-metoxy-1,4-benzoquinol methylase
MLDWIHSLPRKTTALDLGCGKLRYTVPLARRISSVTAVDSTIQLDRKQLLFGKMRSVREYASSALGNVRVCALDDSAWRRQRYEIVLCSNVLSAVPCHKSRKAILQAAAACLAPQGRLLITTQYRNSHFAGWKAIRTAVPYLDGFLVRGKRGASFYGLLDATTLARLCRSCGLRILRSAHVKELAYVLAGRPAKRTTRPSRPRARDYTKSTNARSGL